MHARAINLNREILLIVYVKIVFVVYVWCLGSNKFSLFSNSVGTIVNCCFRAKVQRSTKTV